MTETKKRHWTLRALIFIGKALLAITLLIYIIIGINAATALVQRHKVRSQDISALPQIIKTAVDNNRPEDVTQWVRFRPQTETKKIISIIKPASGKLGPDLFFALAGRQIQNNPEDALFWLQLGRYRLRYDILRCNMITQSDFIEQLVSYMSPHEIRTLLEKNPSLVEKSVRQVLDFDAHYPAANNPAFVCGILNKANRTESPPLPREQWNAIRHVLRQATEAAFEAEKKRK